MRAAEQTPMGLRERTIADFGEQWSHYRDNSGYYGSTELFADITMPLLDPAEIAGWRVVDVGSGTGRIVNMLLDCGASHVVAIEPSAAFAVMRANVSDSDRVTCLNVGGEDIPPHCRADLVVSIGVLHHIPEPAPVVAAAHRALRPGGRILVWLYGREGNAAYLALARPIRAIAGYLPHRWLQGLVWALDVPLCLYIAACRRLPLPMKRYMTEYLGKLAPDKRRLGIYDQLKPAYAKYYTEAQARALIAEAGFEDVRTHHRHGYSWTVLGVKGSHV